MCTRVKHTSAAIFPKINNVLLFFLLLFNVFDDFSSRIEERSCILYVMSTLDFVYVSLQIYTQQNKSMQRHKSVF